MNDSRFIWPKYSLKEKSLVNKVISSNKVNYLFGHEGKEFEKKFSEFSNSKFSLAVANGTLALDLCLRAISIKKNDEVLVTSRSFIQLHVSLYWEQNQSFVMLT